MHVYGTVCWARELRGFELELELELEGIEERRETRGRAGQSHWHEHHGHIVRAVMPVVIRFKLRVAYIPA